MLGLLFSNRAQSSVNTELIVLITPYIVDDDLVRLDAGKQARVEEVAETLEEQPRDISRTMDKLDYFEDTFNFSSDEL